MKDLSGQSPAEIIQKLIDGELSFSDTQKYSRLANTDPEFKKEYENYSRVKNAIKADKQKQLDNAIPSPALKANLMKELGMGSKPVDFATVSTASRFSEFGSFAYGWLTNLKFSVPSLAVITAFTFFALMNENDDKLGIKNNSSDKNNKTSNSKNVPITSTSIDAKTENKTILVDKFEIKSELNNESKVENYKLDVNKTNIKTLSKNKENKFKNNSKTVIKQNNESKSNNNIETSYNEEFNNNIKQREDNYPINGVVDLSKKDSGNDIVSFYNIEKSNLYLNKLELSNQIELINNNKNNRSNTINIATVYSRNNNNNEFTDLGLTFAFSQLTQLNKNEFSIAGYKKLNKESLYIIDGGIEYNRVFLVPISNALTNDGKFDGVGLGGRFVSNGLLKEIFGEQIGEIINPYSGILLGTTTPGLYGKINAGIQLNVVSINGFNLSFTTGYEYFGLLQNNPNFSSERKGIVSGFIVKF